MLPVAEVEVSKMKQNKKELPTDFSHKKIAIKKIPAKAVHIIPKKSADIEKDRNKIRSREDKREKTRSQWHGFEKTFKTTAAKTIKKGNASPKIKIRQRIREGRYRKYFFNEDTEEEIISSDEEKPKDKGEPKIISVQNVQIKLPRLTDKEIDEVIHSKLKRTEEADDIGESVKKIRHEIDQLRKVIPEEPENREQEM